MSSCVDNSGNWGHGGMFDALARLSAAVPDAYERASEFGDLHLGDLHLIEISGQFKFFRVATQIVIHLYFQLQHNFRWT